MEKKRFNPLEWLEQSNQQSNISNHTESTPSISKEDQCKDALSYVSKSPPGDLWVSDFEKIIQQIEINHIDITANYANWRDLGFTLADEYAGSGRDYFHRISRIICLEF